jgi:deoxyadenosine/deoxycytidine kinase
MAKLFSIVGASGVGKTTLVQALVRTGQFSSALEQHNTRPFQMLVTADARYTLPNQIDYFLQRAEQEKDLRAAPHTGLMDGGLDLDFHGFTRLFLSRGLLSGPEFELCERLYRFIRATLPPPELIVSLYADEGTVAGRLAGRKRVNIARAEDTTQLNTYVDEWLASSPSAQVLRLDVSQETLDYPNTVAQILQLLAVR